MLYLIGLGLHINGISKQALEIVKKCKKIYLESYTVNFPYPKAQLENVINKKIFFADREKVEGLEIVDESKKKDVALLVYGSPFFATTHITLIQEAEEIGIRYKIIHNASVFEAVSETGLQLYKFGKITSIPKWETQKNYTPDSFIEIIKQNQSINAHTLILVDIGLNFENALEQLEISSKKYDLKLGKIIICQALGTKDQRIIYKKIDQLKEVRIKKPYCIIIPDKLHFNEKEILKEFIE